MGPSIIGALYTYSQFSDMVFDHLPKTPTIPAQSSCSDVVTRTIITGLLVAFPNHKTIPEFSNHKTKLLFPNYKTTLFMLSKYNLVWWYQHSYYYYFWYLAFRKQRNEVSSIWLFAKETWSLLWRLDQKDRLLGKRLLGLALVKVTVVVCLGQKGVTSIKKLPAYLKPPSVEVKYLACQMQQVKIIGGKYQFYFFLSLAYGHN